MQDPFLELQEQRKELLTQLLGFARVQTLVQRAVNTEKSNSFLLRTFAGLIHLGVPVLAVIIRFSTLFQALPLR